MQARHTSEASRAIMDLARRRLFPSHGIRAANDRKRPGSGSLQISLGGRGKESGEVGPAHGLFFSVFLSFPGKMFCTDHFNLYGMLKWIFNQTSSVFARIRSFAFGWKYPTPHRLRSPTKPNTIFNIFLIYFLNCFNCIWDSSFFF